MTIQEYLYAFFKGVESGASNVWSTMAEQIGN
jgi:hypothetical protein